MSEKPRVVLDTQILLRAVINRRSLPARIVFDLVDEYTLLVSEATIGEIDEVLHRPKVREKFELSETVVQELIHRLSQGELVEVETVVAVSRDPKDDIFLACAETGNADYLVSEDKDLLVLNPYKSIQILNALAFLNMIRPPIHPSESNNQS